MEKRPLQILALIFLIGLFIRIVGLGSIPRGFTPDEASQAYSAFSLLKTDKDEWGVSWPVTSFKSFLDYKSPLQTYLMIPSIAIFGLNEFAARLPSAIFGSLAIISAYFLSSKLAENRKVGLLTSAVLAFSPWAIQFSRMALEANLAVFFITGGLYLFLSSDKKSYILPLSAIFFAVSLYSYHAAKLFVPLLLINLLVIFHKKLFRQKKTLLVSILIGLFIAFPLFTNLLGQDSKRGQDLLITNISIEKLSGLNDIIFYSDLYKTNQLLPRVFHNKVTLILNDFFTNYASYFSLHFWFLEGGREITYSVIPGRGLLFLIFLPFLIFGVVGIVKSNLPAQNKKLLIAWLLLAPIPASLSKEGYRPNRAISFMFLLEFLIAFGVWNFVTSNLKNARTKTLTLVIIFALSFSFYLEDYLFASHVKYPDAMSYGWRETVFEISKIQKNYRTIHVEQGGQAQSMIAFYQKINPSIFQQNSLVWQEKLSRQQDIKYLDQLGDYSLNNFRFKGFSWPEDINSDILYVARNTGTLPQSRKTIKKITTPQGKVLFEIFDFPKI